MDTLDIWHFPKSNQNRKRNMKMDRTNYNLQICWHKWNTCYFRGSNYQSIMYNELGHTLRSESILNHKLDIHHLRHKIQPNNMYKPLGYMLHINQILYYRHDKIHFPQKIQYYKRYNQLDRKSDNLSI